jgi:hypothetical protein
MQWEMEPASGESDGSQSLPLIGDLTWGDSAEIRKVEWQANGEPAVKVPYYGSELWNELESGGRSFCASVL